MTWIVIYRLLALYLAPALSGLIQPTDARTGQVVAYQANRIGDYDGFSLRTSGTTIRLHFPPHTAFAVRQAAAIGQVVTVQVGSRSGPVHRADPTRLRLIRVQNELLKRSVSLESLPPPPPQMGKSVDVNEVLTGTRRDEKGKLVALLTSTHLIELKPHQSEPIQAVLPGVRHVRVVGHERTTSGFVNQTGLLLVQPTLLTIHGQTFAF